MKRLLPAVLLAATALTGSALAAPAVQPLPTPGFASDNVEWLGNIPLNADTSGARLLDGHLYVTSSTQLSIYDVRVPEAPVLLSTFPVPQQAYFAEEDVDTNGEILLISTFGQLVVMDVRDKKAPAVLSVLQGTDEHTISCVLDCTWAYGSAGVIVDLRDPKAPKKAGDWKTAVPGGVGSRHDVTEVAPGMVLTSSTTMALLDARTDPAKPTLVRTAKTDDGRFIHANLWPREMQDRLLLVGGETATTKCDSPRAGAFMTWDTEGWQEEGGGFTMLDEYRPPVTSVPEGDAAYETYCSHWFTTRPGWEDGGQLAVSWYEHGTRFLSVDDAGQIEEIGYFVPVGTTASAAYWASDDVLYVLDYQRGLDVLRFHDDAESAARAKKAKKAKKGNKSDGGLLAAGLRPDQAPLNPRRLLPGMLDGDDWRC
jgi:hypothetical protein